LLIQTASVGPWHTNCHIVAEAAKQECLIIDPGFGAAAFVNETVQSYGLKPVAVLATHGHVDHIWQIFPVATDLDIPAVIHKSERGFLTDPISAISPEGGKLVEAISPNHVWQEPEKVIEISAEINLSFAGFELSVIPTPGHTAGSVCFELGNELFFTGDLLFKNAIGRTDLFSGDPMQMQRSLHSILKRFADDVVIYPGHGPDSCIGDERRLNPYLKDLQDA